MYEAVSLSPSLRPLKSITAPSISLELPVPPQSISFPSLKQPSLPRKFLRFPEKIRVIGPETGALNVWSEGRSCQEELDDSPISVDLEPICSESQFDRVIAEAQQLQEPLIVVWMANWCRKCIYLKPKLEKLAADYHGRLRFYSVNVNNVPHKLVARAGVTKMPTIQLWRDGRKEAEMIGAHKAYLVVNEVREMIENECNP